MKAVNRIVAVLLALVCAFAVAVAVTALSDSSRDIIVWRFAIVVIVALAAAYGAVRMWRRPTA